MNSTKSSFLFILIPFSKCSSLVKSTLFVGFIGVNAAPSLNCIKPRKAAAAASILANFLLRPCPEYF